MGSLSPNFDIREFECRDDCGYGAVHPHLIEVLERIRAGLGGKPLRIISGLRCPPRNGAVGGSPRSAHQWGGAADIPDRLVRRSVAVQAGAKGVGLKGIWVVHVDVRRTREVVEWTYS